MIVLYYVFLVQRRTTSLHVAVVNQTALELYMCVCVCGCVCASVELKVSFEFVTRSVKICGKKKRDSDLIPHPCISQPDQADLFFLCILQTVPKSRCDHTEECWDGMSHCPYQLPALELLLHHLPAILQHYQSAMMSLCGHMQRHRDKDCSCQSSLNLSSC